MHLVYLSSCLLGSDVVSVQIVTVMVVSIDIKNFNPSRVSIFSGVSQGGGGKSGGNGGGILEDVSFHCLNIYNYS